MRRLRGWQALFSALMVVLAGGCGSSLPGTELPLARTVSPALEFPELRDYRGVVDCKMRSSGFEEAKLGALARAAQIDFICLGDPAQGRDSDFGIAGFTEEVLFIPGASYQAANSAAAIVGINLHQAIGAGRSAADIIAQIHGQGALALAANPSKFPSSGDYALADAIEVYNQQSVWDAQRPWGLYLYSIFFGSDRLFSSLDVRPEANLARYDRMVSGARVTLAAGIGGAEQMQVLGTRVGTFEQLLEVYTTHVLAPERQIDPIVDALKHGHSYVAFDFLGYVGSFAFFAERGERKVMMGDEIAMGPGLKLKVEMPSAADRLVIIGNGSEAASAENVAAFEFAPKGPGAYRVEAYRRGCPWIYSNPVYVR